MCAVGSRSESGPFLLMMKVILLARGKRAPQQPSSAIEPPMDRKIAHDKSTRHRKPRQRATPAAEPLPERRRRRQRLTGQGSRG